jgi:hypothetical protein
MNNTKQAMLRDVVINMEGLKRIPPSTLTKATKIAKPAVPIIPKCSKYLLNVLIVSSLPGYPPAQTHSWRKI